MLYTNQQNQVIFRTAPNNNQTTIFYNLSTLAVPSISLIAVVQHISIYLQLTEMTEDHQQRFNLILDYLGNVGNIDLEEEVQRFQDYFETLQFDYHRDGLNLVVGNLSLPNLIDLINSAEFQQVNNLKLNLSVWRVALV